MKIFTLNLYRAHMISIFLTNHILITVVAVMDSVLNTHAAERKTSTQEARVLIIKTKYLFRNIKIANTIVFFHEINSRHTYVHLNHNYEINSNFVFFYNSYVAKQIAIATKC